MWKNIKGFDNYEVSDEGEVRNIDTGLVLKPHDNGHGYLYVGLYVNREATKKYIHRLVAETFIANTDNKPEVNHIDEDKANNSVSNLGWVTAKENANYGTRTERMKNNPEWKKSHAEHLQKLNKSKAIPIIAIYHDNTYEEYPSISVASRELGLHLGNIWKALNGEYKTTGGLKFEYAEGGKNNE